MKSVIATVSLLALMVAAPAWAADTGTGAATGEPQGQQALNQQDRQFINEAAEGGRAEVEMGKVAAERSDNPAVREFGRWMETDHTMANDALDYIVHRAGVTPPSTIDPHDQTALESLQKLHGAAFDQKYVPMQVEGHEQTIALFQKEEQSGENPHLKRYAEHTMPMLRAHLAEAQDLSRLPGMASTRSYSGSSAAPATR